MNRWYGKLLGLIAGALLFRPNPLFGAVVGLLLLVPVRTPTRDEAASSPAIWEGERLVAAPVMRQTPYTARPVRGLEQFRGLIFAH